MWRPESVYDERGHLDEGVIHAWLDGALERDAAREVEAHAEACVTCSARVSEARGLVAGASRVLGTLDGAPGVARGVVPDATPAVVRATAAVDAGKRSSSRKRRWWATRTMGLAAAAVFIFAAGSVVLRDQLGGGGGVREAIVADRAAAPERAAVTSESAFAAAAPAVGDAGVAASAPSGAALPEGVQPRLVAVESPRAQAAAREPAKAEAPAPPPLAPAPAPSISSMPASEKAAESARRREVASIGASTAARVTARAPGAVHLRGQVGSADSGARSDSAIRERWPAAAMNLEAVVVTGLADATISSRVSWISRCWRRTGSDTLYRFARPDSIGQSAHVESVGAHAAERDPPAWMTGDRFVAGSRAGTFEWRAERDSSGVRIRTPGRRGELRLRAGGDSLLEGRTGGGERVRLEARPDNCP